MASERARRRCYEQLRALMEVPADATALRFRIIELLRPVVGFDRWCWPLCDPASGLGTTAVGEHDYWPALQRLLLLDQRPDEPRSLPALKGPQRGSRHGGLRFRDVLGPVGIGDELRIPLTDRHGLWGCLDLMRSSDDRPFDDEDVVFLELVAPLLATATRRSTAAATAGDEVVPPSPAGVIVLDADLDVRASTAGARAWLAQLAPARFKHAHLAALAVVYNVTARALSQSNLAPRARVRAATGAWAIVEADLLDPLDRTVAVTIRPASPGEILDLRMLAHDLTSRERDVVTCVLDGRDTRAVSEQLFLSPHTVNDHLKSIFAKTGVRSRKELVAALARRPGSDARKP
jgi:DNA-binding CsgD family transcriptional regulator